MIYYSTFWTVVNHGRGSWIRTSGLLFPKQALYQTKLYPDTVNTYMKCTSCEIVAAKNAAVKKSYARPKDEPIATSSRPRPQIQSQEVQTGQAEQDS